jgi:hypothetical protein
VETSTSEISPQVSAEAFLVDRTAVRWLEPEGFPKGLSPAGCFAQQAGSGLEMLLATSRHRPSAPELRKAQLTRRAGRASPVLVAVMHPEKERVRVAPCSPVGKAPPVLRDLDPAQVDRIARLALDEPNHHAAVRFLGSNATDRDRVAEQAHWTAGVSQEDR